MGANSVLSAAGIPQVSPTSSSPSLSDDAAYPLFYRIIPSDGLQGGALNFTVSNYGGSSVALIHMTNSYGAGIADSFRTSWEAGGNTLCAQIGYEETSTSFGALAQSVLDNGCDTVVMASYSSDGQMIAEALVDIGFSGSIFGGDGIADESFGSDLSDPSLVNGIIATKPRPHNTSSVSDAFDTWCSNNSTCNSGILQAETYDAVRIIGESYLYSQTSGIPLGWSLFVIGYHWQGASGEITFISNGDSIGHGFEICQFSYSSGTGQVTLSCPETWYPSTNLLVSLAIPVTAIISLSISSVAPFFLAAKL